MSVRLSKQFLKENSVIFFPRTKAEAAFIQRSLFENGIGWTSKGKALHDPQQCVDHGMIVMGGILYTLPVEGTKHFKGIICDVTALSPHFNSSPVAPAKKEKR